MSRGPLKKELWNIENAQPALSFGQCRLSDLEGDTAQISRLSFFAFSYGMWYAVSAISIREEFFIWKSCTSRTPS